MRIALVDGDIVAYRAAAAAQREIDWGDGTKSAPSVDPQAAAEATLRTVDAWTALAGCTQAVVAFTGPNNFRKTVLPTYKSNRKAVPKPMAFAYCVQSVQDRFEHRLVDGLEADDLLGIMATSPRYDGAVIVTIDKDLRTVPAWHCNPLKDTKVEWVPEDLANYLWMAQTLTGDTTDGYAGCPGIGPKKVLQILGSPPQDHPGRPLESLWGSVVQAYGTKGLGLAAALQQARVARILRAQDYHKDTKEIDLWDIQMPTRFKLGD